MNLKSLAIQLSGILCATHSFAVPALGPDFGRDIEPIFAEHCVECHGPRRQKGGLRLDSKVFAMKGGDDGKVLEVGNAEASRLIQLVEGRDQDVVMPPKGKRLSSDEIGLLRTWIDGGAQWADDGKVPRVQGDHWSLQPLRAPEVPVDAGDAIDAFVSARLAKDGLALSPEADRADLIRRLSFDLVGLPPTPEESDAFITDRDPHAYERLVDRLLASPRYGERWGRYWLDIARYTESQGFEYDHVRDNAWHYRDYVIGSFNDDKPYDQFMREQVAGDVIPPLTNDGLTATSLLVCGPWDQAGNSQSNVAQRMTTREDELEDLISVVGQSFLGLTINCARCHSHKFDPIPQEDYYRIKAVFEGVKHGERPLMRSAGESDREATLERMIAEAKERITKLEEPAWQAAMGSLQKGARESAPVAFARWNFEGLDEGAMVGEPKDGARVESGRLVLPMEGAYFETAPLPKDVGEKTLEAWVSLANLDQGGGAAISIEGTNGTPFDAIVFGERQARKWVAGSEGFARTLDLDAPLENEPAGTMMHMAIVYRADNSIAVYRNGQPYGQSYKPDHPLRTYKAGEAHVVLGLRHKGGGRPWLTGMIRQAALYDRALSAEEIARSFRSGGFSVPESAMLEELGEIGRAEREAAMVLVKSAGGELAILREKSSPGVTYAGTRVQPEPTRFLQRGEVTAPKETVTPGALSAITELESDFGLPSDAPEGERRLKFADWLADPRHPLPARVMANRVWHWHFGQGIVATPSDLGESGARPSHPELLDWLAVKFIESGWSVKALHRLIVNSATYRQSSRFQPKAAELDAENQLLWRYTPRRIEAEVVRDAMLAVSGQLNLEMGGPGFRPFTTTTFNATFYHLVDRSEPEYNRRTVYRINVNSGKDPMLEAFDGPEPSVKTPRRGVTTTPLQALQLMNNSFVQRQAHYLAERAASTANGDTETAIRAAYRLALGRFPNDAEAANAFHAARERGLQSVCWALLNSTEFIYVK